MDCLQFHSNKSRTIQWITSGNCNVIGHKQRRYFSKLIVPAFCQTWDIGRNVLGSFKEPSMESPYSWSFLLYQHDGRKIARVNIWNWASLMDRLQFHSNKSRTIQWIKSGNCNVIGHKQRRYFSKLIVPAFSQTWYIGRNVLGNFTEPSMESPYSWSFLLYQHDGRKIARVNIWNWVWPSRRLVMLTEPTNIYKIIFP